MNERSDSFLKFLVCHIPHITQNLKYNLQETSLLQSDVTCQGLHWSHNLHFQLVPGGGISTSR
jgi:hypothetical protein